MPIYEYRCDSCEERFEEYLEVLTRLLGEGPSDFEGRHQVLRRGQVFGPPCPEPWVAAGSYPIVILAKREKNKTEHATKSVEIRVGK